MKDTQIQTIQLKEIADYRGNLSFAEQDNPIPFDIKSAFWTTINEDHSFIAENNLFLLPLDGEICINNDIFLNKPCEAIAIAKESSVDIKLLSENAILLLISDSIISDSDISKNTNNGLLEMPFAENYYGFSGYFANSESTLPFDIKRVYFTYDIPDFAKRGGHAHLYTKEIVFAIKGGVDVISENNNGIKQTHSLDNQYQGAFLNIDIWRDLQNFKDNSTLLVIASEKYFEPDYIRKYDDFCTEIKRK